jgi:hypothetical protein
MAISFVNGFMCTSSCDVAKAKKGEDPHPNLHTTNDADGKQGRGGKSSALDGPAVVFGGSLADTAQAMMGAAATDRPDPANLRKQGFSLDVLA